MPSRSKRGSCHIPFFWSLIPIGNARAPAGSARTPRRTRRVTRDLRMVSGSRARSRTDRHGEAPGPRGGEPGLEGVQTLDRPGMVAGDPRDPDGPADPPAGAERLERPPRRDARALLGEGEEAVGPPGPRAAHRQPRAAPGQPPAHLEAG